MDNSQGDYLTIIDISCTTDCEEGEEAGYAVTALKLTDGSIIELNSAPLL